MIYARDSTQQTTLAALKQYRVYTTTLAGKEIHHDKCHIIFIGMSIDPAYAQVYMNPIPTCFKLVWGFFFSRYDILRDLNVTEIDCSHYSVLSAHLTSSKSLVGIAGVVSEIQSRKRAGLKHQNVGCTKESWPSLMYVPQNFKYLGSANVGKSVFISALLNPIQIDAFLGGGKLFDTPGVHLRHRQAVVHSEDLPTLAPRSRLKGQSFPACTHPNRLQTFSVCVHIDIREIWLLVT
ncbi:hypothetical protein DKX38_027494 [Salix brachista]|uniref:G domain-containing protein n=1 Tax=Salix brachista TaxID=2182728 RepID=A0A5N5JDV4_9ROSI|nr:hypothetical protein DKX38_027494 [Salix brachista]